jgi:thiol-disulfide isomerase/thioredoxin
MRKITLALIFILATCLCSRADKKLTVAETILATAQKQAKHEHKGIFLIFGASWCGPCKKLDAFLNEPANRSVIDKYFIVTRLTVAEQYGGNPKLNTPGGDKLFTQFGGPGNSVPFLVLLNSKADLVTNSNRPIGNDKIDNIGYPDEPLEILWFVSMLKQAAPEMSDTEEQTLGEWLKKSANHQPKPGHRRLPSS